MVTDTLETVWLEKRPGNKQNHNKINNFLPLTGTTVNSKEDQDCRTLDSSFPTLPFLVVYPRVSLCRATPGSVDPYRTPISSSRSRE